jgi:dolichyl-phosphate beta-glucosyltransferase
MQKGLVIPCYNETQRLRHDQIDLLLAAQSNLTILMVDDGSSDGTADMLRVLAKQNPQIQSLILPQNRGKAEAVRAGLLELLNRNFTWVGFADADFATPAEEILRLFKVADAREPVVVMGARVRLLGTEIHRKPLRHYLGRIFATFSSLVLRLPVYDTQCGAKLFRATPGLCEALSTPFRTTWIFDVELLGRLLTSDDPHTKKDFVEVPLQYWRDVEGSKLKKTAMVRAAWDLVRVAVWLSSRRHQLSARKH